MGKCILGESTPFNFHQCLDVVSTWNVRSLIQCRSDMWRYEEKAYYLSSEQRALYGSLEARHV